MNGSKCAKYTFENGNVGSLQQVFPIEPECVYKVTCWIKWEGCRQLAIAQSGRDGWEFSYFPFDDSMLYLNHFPPSNDHGWLAKI